MSRALTILALLVTFTAASFLAGCGGGGGHSDPDPLVYISNGKLIRVPPGGDDLGDLQVFDVAVELGNISDEDDADGYPLTLLNDGLLVISAESNSGLNPFVEVYDSEGNFVASDDDSGIGLDAMMVGPLDAGNYTIVAWSSLSGPFEGDFTLVVTVGGPGGEDLGVRAPASSITSTIGELFAGADSNTFVFTLDQTSTIDLSAAQLPNGLADIGLQIADLRGNELAFADPAGLSDPSMTGVLLQRGTYLIVVSNPPTGDAGLYDLTLTVAP